MGIWTTVSLGILFTLFLIGIIYQAINVRSDQHRFPPMGQLIDIGGFRLHYHCLGEGTPTVILDAGGGAPGISWGVIPSEISKFTRVCTYDRAGFGWSDPNPKAPRTSQQNVDELHLLLQTAKISPPYILVGHSLGGVNMRLYASQFPEDVIGLVLVDSSHEHQITPDIAKRVKITSGLYQLIRVISPLGVLRFIGENNLLPILKQLKKDIQKYPPAVHPLFDTFKSFCYRPHYWATAANEFANINISLKSVESVRSLGELPLVVLSQGAKDPRISQERRQQWAALQSDLTKLSSNSQHIIAENSGHNIPLDQPNLVVNVVQQLTSRFSPDKNPT